MYVKQFNVRLVPLLCVRGPACLGVGHFQALLLNISAVCASDKPIASLSVRLKPQNQNPPSISPSLQGLKSRNTVTFLISYTSRKFLFTLL